ncbi:hypothetical protein CSB37_01180 [bacterium DOLZORAL124_38_8]|nr:MAG: hypothetical protein CSB37_01180 [bacterium DOLZORAL124_38_8]
MRKTVLPTISLKEELTPEEFESFNKISAEFGEKLDELRLSIRNKLQKLGNKHKALRFLAKPKYKRKIDNKEQIADIQGTIHTGTEEMFVQIEQEKNQADLAIQEGIEDKKLNTKSLINISNNNPYKDQNDYVFATANDIISDTSEKQINETLKKRLSPTEFEIFQTQSKITDSYENHFQHQQNHSLYLSVQKGNKAEMVEDMFWGKEELPDQFSSENIEKTANLEGNELKEALSESINQINLYVIGVNNSKPGKYQDKLISNLQIIKETYLYPLKYIWQKNGEYTKIDWLNNQILRFTDPNLHIQMVYEETILEERNNIAVSTISKTDPNEHQTIHANYGEAHLSGMHERMLQEGWTLEDIELMGIKYPKVPWWKRLGETLKKPFWYFKNRKERKKLRKLLKQARKENQSYVKSFDTQVEIFDKKGRPKLVPFPEISNPPEPEKVEEKKSA